jgi:hypothetical protein
MMYSLDAIVDFAQHISNACGGLVPRLDSAKNWHGIEDWHANKTRIKQYHENLQKDKTNSVLFSLYAQALKHATNYLIEKRQQGTEPTIKRCQFLEIHVNHLYQVQDFVFGTKRFSLPSQQKSPFAENTGLTGQLLEGIKARNANTKAVKLKYKKAIKGIFNEGKKDFNTPNRSLEVESFLASEKFGQLKSYQKFLSIDERNHRFFCFDLSVKQKAQVLQKMIDSIEGQSTMVGVKKVLSEFYEGRHCQISYDGGISYQKSPYEILNTGQNITTRLLSDFGLKTNCINRLDAVNDLAKSYRIDTSHTNGM